MLAGRRSVVVGGEGFRTPLLVPSFSSKCDTNVTLDVQMRTMGEHIATPILLSAYDIHYGRIAPPTFPSLIFLDSGGYEAHRDVGAAERGERETLREQPWNRDLHESVMAGLNSRVPVVAISYDHPNERTSIADQVAAAKAALSKGMTKELLFKPSAPGDFISVPEVAAVLDQLEGFAVLGFTDKELGRSMQDRLFAVGRLRKAIRDAGHETPIHVFGSLDPITTPLYFLAGADVFDGLAWLRYAMDERGTTYMQNYGVLECGLASPPESVQAQAWVRNFTFLTVLQNGMRSFLRSGDWNALGPHAEVFRRASETIEEEVEG